MGAQVSVDGGTGPRLRAMREQSRHTHFQVGKRLDDDTLNPGDFAILAVTGTAIDFDQTGLDVNDPIFCNT